MTVDQLPLPAYQPGAIKRPASPVWQAFGPSRLYRNETLAELWANCRKNYPGHRLDINERTRAALEAAKAPLDGAHVNAVVPDGQVWVLLEQTR